MAEYIVQVGDISIVATCFANPHKEDDMKPFIYTVEFTDTFDGTGIYMADIAGEIEQLDILADWLRHDAEADNAARERLVARGLENFLS